MRNELITKASRLASQTGLQIKKYSPEILMVTGIAGTIASTIMACKSTTKLDGILNETKQTTDIIHKGMEDGSINGIEYTEEDGKKDLTIIYTQTGVKLFKLYAPSIALGVLSITSIVAGHIILKKRNIALAAAYAVVDKGFKDYRKNVVERFGEELDKELRYNIKAKEIETITTDENGEETVKKEIIKEFNLNEISDYARFFDETCSNYHKDSEYNLMFLRRQQDYFNEVLRTKGHVFLNDVYEQLGIPKSKGGQIVGWVYDTKNPKGDNYIDFGIYRINSEKHRDFVNGYEKAILLDFNVDGIIYDLI